MLTALDYYNMRGNMPAIGFKVTNRNYSSDIDTHRTYERTKNEAYNRILDKKESSGLTAKDFFKGLTSEELYTIAKYHNMGSTLAYQNMSVEGAENLLIGRNNATDLIDLNNDSLIEYGEMAMFSFPPPNAPEIVSDSFDTLEDDMSENDRFYFTLFMLKGLKKDMINSNPNTNFSEEGLIEKDLAVNFGGEVDKYVSVAEESIQMLEELVTTNEDNNINLYKRCLGFFEKFIYNIQ